VACGRRGDNITVYHDRKLILIDRGYIIGRRLKIEEYLLGTIA
jgi:hypothetical protein